MDSVTAYVIAVVFVATLVRSTFGFGEALVAVPLLALRVPVEVAVPLATLLSIAVAAVVLVQDARHVEVRSAVSLVAATLFGLPLGIWLLRAGNARVVKAVLATVILAFATYALARRSPPRLERDSRAWRFLAGFVAGVLGGAYGMNGPPLVVYGAMRGWPAVQFRATLQAYFLPASLIAFAGYAATGLLAPVVWRDFAFALPGVVFAIALGRVLNRRIPDGAFVRYVYVGLVAIGLVLLAQVAYGTSG